MFKIHGREKMREERVENLRFIKYKLEIVKEEESE